MSEDFNTCTKLNGRTLWNKCIDQTLLGSDTFIDVVVGVSLSTVVGEFDRLEVVTGASLVLVVVSRVVAGVGNVGQPSGTTSHFSSESGCKQAL